MDSELIIISEYCDNSKIEPQFIVLLEEEGLIETCWIEGQQYLIASQLADLERFARWYYDLSINVEGIDTIQRLLTRMEKMQVELNRLKRFMRAYGDNTAPDFDNEYFI